MLSCAQLFSVKYRVHLGRERGDIRTPNLLVALYFKLCISARIVKEHPLIFGHL